MPRLLRIGIITCLLAGLGALGVGPARANCIRGEVVLHKSGQADQTLWPESYCFYESGSGDFLIRETDVAVTGLPNGVPNGVRVKVWVSIP